MDNVQIQTHYYSTPCPIIKGSQFLPPTTKNVDTQLGHRYNISKFEHNTSMIDHGFQNITLKD